MFSNLCLGLPDGEEVDLDRIFTILKLCGVPEISDIIKNELQTKGGGSLTTDGICFEETSHIKTSDSDMRAQWHKSLTQSQKVRLNMARALISNPNIMIISRSLSGLHDHAALEMLDLLREHVVNRGLLMPEDSIDSRRPRNVIFSTESVEQASKADIVWLTDPKSKSVSALAPSAYLSKVPQRPNIAVTPE